VALTSTATPQGFSFAAARCGLKNKRKDIGLILSDRPAMCAAVLTTNQVRAACVDYTHDVVQHGYLRGVVVNSGNANCCTGTQGAKDCAAMAKIAAEVIGLSQDEMAVSSTGVIGHTLDMVKVERGILDACQLFSQDPNPFMEAILTTDLVEKWAVGALNETVVYGTGETVPELSSGKMLGVAKGSGMIAPNMATMLAYVVTDLDCSSLDLQACLEQAVATSFNCMTVDGDTSTNDTLLLLANGASGIVPSLKEFNALLSGVCVSLAKQVAKDGEGATKLIEVRVSGTSDPKKIARTIAESPLVKTAMFGCDPNWGRVLMAAGRAGVPFSQQDIRLSIVARDEEFLLFESGAPAPFDAARVSAALKSDQVIIDLRIAPNDAPPAVVYTCDLGYGYVRINAEYHT
jgi:glutamate N-acetyltransferase/amino-acid N-acetyltransferase